MPGELPTLTQRQLRPRAGRGACRKALRVPLGIKPLLGQCGPVLLEMWTGRLPQALSSCKAGVCVILGTGGFRTTP